MINISFFIYFSTTSNRKLIQKNRNKNFKNAILAALSVSVTNFSSNTQYKGDELEGSGKSVFPGKHIQQKASRGNIRARNARSLKTKFSTFWRFKSHEVCGQVESGRRVAPTTHGAEGRPHAPAGGAGQVHRRPRCAMAKGKGSPGQEGERAR